MQVWHEMEHRLKPWNRDTEKIVGMGALQNKLNEEYRRRKRGGRSSTNHNNDNQYDAKIKQEAKNAIVDQYRKRLNQCMLIIFKN